MISFNDWTKKDPLTTEASRSLIAPKLEHKVRKEIMRRMEECFDAARDALSTRGYDGRYSQHKDWKKSLADLSALIPIAYRQIENAAREMARVDDGMMPMSDLERKIIESAEEKIWKLLEEYDK